MKRGIFLTALFLAFYYYVFSQEPKNLSLILEKFNFSAPTQYYYITDNEDTLALAINFEDGSAILGYRETFPPVKFFSEKPLNFQSPEFQTLISMIKYDFKQITDDKALQKHNKELWLRWFSGKGEVFTDTLGYLLKSEYGQVNCKDENGRYIYVTNYYTPNHYAVGCVALTFATVMRYFEWPLTGVGSHSYSDTYGSFTGTYSADFENTSYRWDLIQDKYYKVPSTEESRQALGRVAFDAAVSVDMDFESTGSTSNINRIPLAAHKYFRYERAEYLTTGSSYFWQKIDSSLQALSPVILAVYTDDGDGHAVVCDGRILTDEPSDKYYHLNMGWWGSVNGWYLIQGDFNAGGYTIVDAAVMGLLPIPQFRKPTFDINTGKLTVVWDYPQKIKGVTFVLQYRTEDTDWQTLTQGDTLKQYSFVAEKTTYYFRVKTDKNVSWSEEESFSVDEVYRQFQEIKVFPTFAYDKLHIQYENLKNAKVYIYSLNGKTEYFEDLSGFDGIVKTIDLDLSAGLYLVRVIADDKQASFKVFFTGKQQ